MLFLILNNPQAGIAMFFMIVLAISLHEMAHAWAAHKCGDDTAALMGRLTLNPVEHFDPMGITMIFLVGFGWGKPVPVNPLNLRDMKRDSMLIAAAGPISNIIQAVALAFLFHIVTYMPIAKAIFTLPYGEQALQGCVLVFETGVYINLLLAFFNMIPLFPLDGEKILIGILPYNKARAVEEFRNQSTMILMGILMVEFALGIPIIRTYLHLTVNPFAIMFLGFNPFGRFI